MSAVEAQVRPTRRERRTRLSTLFTYLPPILFSLFYFLVTYLRSSQKYFWFDEFATRDICRLPMHSVLEVLRQGADFNPPLFFLVTKVSIALLGETLIGMRAPEIVGFWVLCLCIYSIVYRYSGWLAASVAMLLPMVTGAYYYAYEARPHGIVLGMCGLAFVCWQSAIGTSRPRRWLLLFSVCLLAAFLLHCYAILICIPFAVFEVVHFVQGRRIRWPMWISMAAPVSIAIAFYVPLLLSYRKYATNTDYQSLFPPSVGALSGFYVYLVAPCIFVILISVALFAIANVRGFRDSERSRPRTARGPMPEVIVSLGFLFLPVLGVILAVIVRGPFFGRYFLTTSLGLCVLIGLAAGLRHSVNWIAVVLATFLALPVLWNSAALLWHRSHGTAEDLAEPSTGFDMNSSLGGPLERYNLLTSHSNGSNPIAVLDPLDFLYLVHYAPDLRSRLYYIQGAPNDFAYIGFRNFHAWAPFKFNRELTKKELLALSPHALVYGRTIFLNELVPLAEAGGIINSLQFANHHFLFDLQQNPGVIH